MVVAVDLVVMVVVEVVVMVVVEVVVVVECRTPYYCCIKYRYCYTIYGT